MLVDEMTQHWLGEDAPGSAPSAPAPGSTPNAPSASPAAPAPSATPAASTKVRTYRSITREQFLMREMRLVARLLLDGVSADEIVQQAVQDNIFQYPTTTMTGNIARACLMRFDALGPAHEQVTALIAHGTPTQAAQANLYAMARTYAIVWEFLVRVVGWHYSTLDYNLTIPDINVFFADMQSEQPAFASWSESTFAKTRQVLRKSLVESGQLEDSRSTKLIPVFLDPEVRNAIRLNGDNQILPAFNCMEVA